jgi:hypothetical protein
MGFLLRLTSESVLDSETLEGSVWVEWVFLGPDCRGP